MKRHATVTSESGATPHTDLSRFYLLFRIYRVTRTALAWYNGLYRVRPKARLKEGWAPPRCALPGAESDRHFALP